MKKQISAFIKDLRAGDRLQGLEPASIKQGVVLRLLSYLGWDIFNVDEVSPDFSAAKLTIAYGMHIGAACKMLLDVRRGHDDSEAHLPQLVAAAVRHSVDLAAHTDGRHWSFYLVSAAGDWKQKRCHVIDFSETKPDQAAAELISLLSREAVAGGGHIEAARAALQEQKRRLAAAILPEAWNALISPPYSVLVGVLSEAVEKSCGHRPSPQAVEAFLRKQAANWLLIDAAAADPTPVSAENRAVPAPGADPRPKKPEFLSGKPIRAFSLKGSTFSVKSWEDMLTTICNHFAVSHAPEFEKVLWMYDDDRQCFSRYADQLRIPEKIKKTNIYVETKLAPEEILKTVGDLLTEFGYGHEELEITTQ